MKRHIHHGKASDLLRSLCRTDEWIHKIDLRSKFLNSLPPEYAGRRYHERSRLKKGMTLSGFKNQLFSDHVRDLVIRGVIEREWIGPKGKSGSMWKARLIKSVQLKPAVAKKPRKSVKITGVQASNA